MAESEGRDGKLLFGPKLELAGPLTPCQLVVIGRNKSGLLHSYGFMPLGALDSVNPSRRQRVSITKIVPASLTPKRVAERNLVSPGSTLDLAHFHQSFRLRFSRGRYGKELLPFDEIINDRGGKEN